MFSNLPNDTILMSSRDGKWTWLVWLQSPCSVALFRIPSLVADTRSSISPSISGSVLLIPINYFCNTAFLLNKPNRYNNNNISYIKRSTICLSWGQTLTQLKSGLVNPLTPIPSSLELCVRKSGNKTEKKKKWTEKVLESLSCKIKIKTTFCVLHRVIVRIKLDNAYNSALETGPISTKYSCKPCKCLAV